MKIEETIYRNMNFCSRVCDNLDCEKNTKNIPKEVIRDNGIRIVQRFYTNCNHYVKVKELEPEIKQETLF